MNPVTPFLNRINASESICSFKIGLMVGTKNFPKIIHVLAFDDAWPKILQKK